MSKERTVACLVRLLIGLYVPFLLALCAAYLCVAGWLVYRTPRSVVPELPVLIALVLLVGFVPLFWCLLALLMRLRLPPRTDLPLPVDLVSGLHNLAADVARRHRLPRPHEIRLAVDTIAHVYENQDGTRILVLGGMAVRTFSAEALSGVMAHELGHFAAGDTSVLRKTWKTRARMACVEHAFRGKALNFIPTAWIVRTYHLLTLYLWSVHSRHCEFAADRMAVRQLGKGGAAAALIHLTVCERMPWLRLSSIAQSYAVGGQSLEHIFAEQAERARRVHPSDWQEACARTLAVRTEPFDSHPCLRERLAAMKISARKALKLALDQSGQPACELIPGWEQIEKAMTAEIIRHARIAHSAKMELAQIFAGPRRR